MYSLLLSSTSWPFVLRLLKNDHKMTDRLKLGKERVAKEGDFLHTTNILPLVYHWPNASCDRLGRLGR
jgi:hypothetical protein